MHDLFWEHFQAQGALTAHDSCIGDKPCVRHAIKVRVLMANDEAHWFVLLPNLVAIAITGGIPKSPKQLHVKRRRPERHTADASARRQEACLLLVVWLERAIDNARLLVQR